MHAFLALLRDAQPSGCFSAPDVCLIPALAEGLGYGGDRAFFRAAGLPLLGLANTIPEPLGRAAEPSPLDAGRLRILHNLVAQWRTTGAWQTLRQALLPTTLVEAEGDRKGPHVQLDRDADPDIIVEEAEGDRKGPHVQLDRVEGAEGARTRPPRPLARVEAGERAGQAPPRPPPSSLPTSADRRRTYGSPAPN